MTKYHSRKVTINGITFASKLEAERYQQLVLLSKAKEIFNLQLQPEFQIYKGWIDPDTGEKHKSRFYVADFLYLDARKHQWIVEDTKGIETDVFRLKWEYVQSEYPEYVFVKLTRKDI